MEYSSAMPSIWKTLDKIGFFSPNKTGNYAVVSRPLSRAMRITDSNVEPALKGHIPYAMLVLVYLLQVLCLPICKMGMKTSQRVVRIIDDAFNENCLMESWLLRCVCAQLCLILCDPMDYIACQAPLSMGFPRQEYRSGLPSPSLGESSQRRVQTMSPVSPALVGRFLTT